MRRKSRNILIVIVLLVVAVPFAIKGLMYLRVKLAMDDFVDRAGSEVEITYGAIDTELKGAASVENIRITPLEFEHPIEISRLRLETGNPWTFIDPSQWRSQGGMKMPPQLRMDVQSVRIPMEKAVYESFRQRLEMQRQLGAQLPDACESFNLDPIQLKAMGFDHVTLDLDMNYRFYEADERLDVAMDFELYDIESVSLSMALEGVVPEDIEAGRVAGVRFVKADMRVRLEPEFGRRFVKHCAQRKQLTPEAYVDALIGYFRDNLQRTGITLGQELQHALEGYYREWGDIRLHVKPEEPIAPLQLMTIKPERLVQTLGISLFVNDKPVNDLDVRLDLQRMTKGVQAAPAEGTETGKSKAPRRVRIIREFHPIAVQNLDQYLGSRVRIYPQGQPQREGALVAIVGGEVQVEQRAHGGSVTSYIPLKQIRSVEVEKLQRQPLN